MSLTDEYLAAAATRGPKAGAILEAAAPKLDATTFLGRCLSRPAFLGAAEYRQLKADLDLLHSALTRLPERVFGGDLAQFARTVGLTEAQVQAVSRGRGAAPSRMGRADMYRDDDGFHLLEINMGSTVGGVDNPVLNAAMMEHPFIADFVAANNLTYAETMADVVRTILTEAKVPTGVRPVMAIADFPDSYPELERQLRKSAEMLAQLGIDALPCPVDALEYRDDRIWLGDRPIDVVFRLFMIEDVLKPGAVELLEPVLKASERGHVSIFTRSPQPASTSTRTGCSLEPRRRASTSRSSPRPFATRSSPPSTQPGSSTTCSSIRRAMPTSTASPRSLPISSAPTGSRCAS
jgi:hypothetical protein